MKPLIPEPVLTVLRLCSSAPSVGSDIAEHIRTLVDAVRMNITSLENALLCPSSDDRTEWSAFLLGEEDADARIGFVEALVRCAGEREEYRNSTDDVEVTSACANLLAASLECLSLALRVRSEAIAEGGGVTGGGKGVTVWSLVGKHLPSLAPSILSAFEVSDEECAMSLSSSMTGCPGLASACRDAAMELTKALLPPACPREECAPSSVRDGVLLPLSENPDTAQDAAEVLAWCVGENAAAAASSASVRCGAIGGGMTHARKSELDEASRLKAEGAALGRLQEMRGVLENVARLAAGPDGERIREALKSIYEVAPHAVESQLGGADDRSGLLTFLGKDHSEISGCKSPLHVSTESDLGSPTAEEEEEEEEENGSGHAMPLLYAKISGPPIEICSEKQLLAELESINGALREFDQELWNNRFEALKKMERILAGNIIRSPQLRSIFLAKLRKMPVSEQIEDLRSQITRQAVQFVVALAYEMRAAEEQECSVAMAFFAERWTESILKLSISGVRLMATQGMNGMLHLYALGGGYGYPRTIQTLCEGCTGKKIHPNHRRGCVLALTAALRVWNVHSLEKHVDQICRAVSAAASDRDPTVREEGRKAYWALHYRPEFRSSAVALLSKMDMREQKRLHDIKTVTDGEWAEGGRMEVFVRTGMDVGVDGSPKATSTFVAKGAKGAGGRPMTTVGKGLTAASKSRNSCLAAAKARGKAALASNGRKNAATSVATPSQRKATNDSASGRTSFAATPRSSVQESKRLSFIPSAGKVAGTRSPNKKLMPGTPMSASSPVKTKPSDQSSISSTAKCLRPKVGTQFDSRNEFIPMKAEPVFSHGINIEQQKSSPGKPPPIETFLPPAPVSSSTDEPMIIDLDTIGSGDKEDDELFSDLRTPRSASPLSEDLKNDVSDERSNNGHQPSTSALVENIKAPPKSVIKTAVKFATETISVPPTPPTLEPHQNLMQVVETKTTPQQYLRPNPDSVIQRSETRTPSASQPITPHFNVTDPVLRYMARPSPLSSEKLDSFRDANGNVLPSIIAKLSRASLPQEQHLGIKALTQYARQNGEDDRQWKEHFEEVLKCLLDGFSAFDKGGQEGSNNDVLTPVSVNMQCIKAVKMAEDKESNLCLAASTTATQHLYIQGVRALLKYVPLCFETHVNKTMGKLLECAKCSKYEIVHTAERALENMVTYLDPLLCLQSLLPHLVIAGENADGCAVSLLGLKTLCKLVSRVPAQPLLDALPSFEPCLMTGMRHKLVDMRKASVFAVVEMYFVIGDTLMSRLEGLTAGNIKLISIYIERHPKSDNPTAAEGQAVIARGSPGVAVMHKSYT